MTVTIVQERASCPDGAALIAELDREILDRYPPEMCYLTPADELDRLGEFYIAREDGTTLGCGCIKALSQGEMEIKRMYVRPQARGKKVATAILETLEAAARRQGAKTLLLETGPRQPEAIGLYERAGYVRRGPYADYREDPEASVFMEKRLA